MDDLTRCLRSQTEVTEYAWTRLAPKIAQWIEGGEVSFHSVDMNEAAPATKEIVDFFDDTATVYNLPPTAEGRKSHAAFVKEENHVPVLSRAPTIPGFIHEWENTHSDNLTFFESLRIDLTSRLVSFLSEIETILRSEQQRFTDNASNEFIDMISSKDDTEESEPTIAPNADYDQTEEKTQAIVQACRQNTNTKPKLARPIHLIVKFVATELLGSLALLVETIAILDFALNAVCPKGLLKRFSSFTDLLFALGEDSLAYQGFISVALDKRCSLGIKALVLSISLNHMAKMAEKVAPLVAPSLAVLVSQSSRDAFGNPVTIKEGLSEDSSIQDFFTAVFDCTAASDIYSISDHLNNPNLWGSMFDYLGEDASPHERQSCEVPSIEEAFPLGSIVLRNISVDLRHSVAMTWLIHQAPQAFGGSAGALSRTDDFHAVARSSIASFIVRVLDHQVFFWETGDLDSPSFSLPFVTSIGGASASSLFLKRYRFWIMSGLRWFTIYHPKYHQFLRNSSTTTDGTEALAGDLELGPLAPWMVFYAHHVLMSSCEDREFTPSLIYATLPSVLSQSERSRIVMRTLLTLSIVCAAKIESRAPSIDHVPCDHLMKAYLRFLDLIEPIMASTYQESTFRTPLSKHQFSVNLKAFFTTVSICIAELEHIMHEGIHSNSSGVKVLGYVMSFAYPDEIHHIVEGLLKDGSTPEQCGPIKSSNAPIMMRHLYSAHERSVLVRAYNHMKKLNTNVEYPDLKGGVTTVENVD